MDSFDNIPIWDGNPGTVSGSTAFHYYDDNANFVADAMKFATYATSKLGYPILNVELKSENIYISYEDAVMEYSRQINEFNASDNLLSLQGAPTSSNLTHKNISTNLAQMIRIAKTYGTETGIGGLVNVYSGSIDIVAGQQYYDIQSL